MRNGRKRAEVIETHLATFRCTKISPGLAEVITDSGTRESEQPIHRIYTTGRREILRNPDHFIRVTDLGVLALARRAKEMRVISIDVFCPSMVRG